MIGITIKGQSLFIPADTSITMEQSAAWADIDNLSSDIVWTFNLPAAPNSQFFEQAEYLVVSNHRGYDCTITFHSIPIASGTLYIQQAADEQTLSCGITFNQFSIGWGDKYLSENNLNYSRTIATTASTYRTEWISFLQSTLAPDSFIKFMLFVDQNFMPDNDDFGYFRNQLSHLESSYVESLMASYVNRLTTDAQGNIINEPSTNSIGTRIFNEDSGMVNGNKVNGYHFAPAIRLRELVAIIAASAGFRVEGSFVTDPHISNLFVQSMRAMDGNILQYPVEQYIKVRGNAVCNNTTPAHLQHPMQFLSPSDQPSQGFRMQSAYDVPTIDFKLLIPSQELASVPSSDTSELFNQYDECWFLAVRYDSEPSSAQFPTHRHMTAYMDGVRHYLYGNLISRSYLNHIVGLPDGSAEVVQFSEDGSDKDICTTSSYSGSVSLISGTLMYDFIQLTPDTKNPSICYTNNIEGAYTEGSYTLERWANQSHQTADTNMCIQLVKARVHSRVGGGNRVLTLPDGGTVYYSFANDGACFQKLSDFEVVDYATIDYNDTPLNVFSSVLRLSDHVPHLTNSDFLKAICKFFGLNLYVDSLTKVLQLSFFRDIAKAQSLDISEYVTAFTKLQFDPTCFDLTIKPTRNAQDINPAKVIPPVLSRADLPPASGNKNKYCIVMQDNAYHKSVKDSNSSRYAWEINHGTDATLTIGDTSQQHTSESADVYVNNMRSVDTAHTPKHIEEIDNQGCSSMFQDSFSGEFPLILRQYRGRKLMQLQSAHTPTECYIEYGNPTNLNPDGTADTDYINLTSTGQNSVGELWQHPLYSFLASRENFEFSLRVPFSFFQQLYSLLQPQLGDEHQQVRFVHYRSQRYLPYNISYQFSASQPSILVTLSCSRF